MVNYPQIFAKRAQRPALGKRAPGHTKTDTWCSMLKEIFSTKVGSVIELLPLVYITTGRDESNLLHTWRARHRKECLYPVCSHHQAWKPSRMKNSMNQVNRFDDCYKLIAEIIKPFDLCAIQEIRADLDPLMRVMELLGNNYSLLF